MNGAARSSIARLNADGTHDTSFNPGAGTDYDVRTVAVQADGKIMIGGRFSTFDGVSHNNLARLNANVSIDTSFNPAAGTNSFGGDVEQIVIQPDGRILLGGAFQMVNGVGRNFLARLNTDGSLDASFNPLPGSFVRPSGASALALQPDGKVSSAARFTTA